MLGLGASLYSLLRKQFQLVVQGSGKDFLRPYSVSNKKVVTFEYVLFCRQWRRFNSSCLACQALYVVPSDISSSSRSDRPIMSLLT